VKVEDFNGACEVKDSVELEKALKKRYGHESNSFWLTHDSKKYPSMAVMVKGDLATLNYFSGDDSAGFRSKGRVEELTPGGMSIFF
jgi:hypothetical protein